MSVPERTVIFLLLGVTTLWVNNCTIDLPYDALSLEKLASILNIRSDFLFFRSACASSVGFSLMI